MPRRVMTQKETVLMSELMKLHIKVLPPLNEFGGVPYCEYEAGWDDKRVATEIASDLSATHAGGLRNNLFGRLNDRKDADRLALIEQKLGDALKMIAELVSKHDKLCTGISVARVGVDARHLLIDQSLRDKC